MFGLSIANDKFIFEKSSKQVSERTKFQPSPLTGKNVSNYFCSNSFEKGSEKKEEVIILLLWKNQFLKFSQFCEWWQHDERKGFNELILYFVSDMFFFKKWAIPGLFFLYFHLFNTQLTVNKCSIYK